MKKIFSIFAASLMLFAASCSTEKLDEPTGDGNVTFTVQLPGGLQSRAIGDGTTATKLYVAAYEANQTTPLAVANGAQSIADMSNLNATVSLQLVTGKTYDIVFWAQAADAPYTFNPTGRTVDMNYSGATANAENRDAFFHIENGLTVTGPMEKDITLKRPFAQLNFVTADYEAAKAGGIDATTTSVKVKNLKPTLSLVDGTAAGDAAEVTFTTADRPTETMTINGNTYDYLAMNYLLIDDTRDVVECEMTAYDAADANDTRVLTVSNVPVQRNYRTNIYGNLLTSTTTFNVTIDPIFNAPDNNTNPFAPTVNGVEYASFAEAVAAINASSETSFDVVLHNGESWETGNAGNGANTAFTNSAATVNVDLNGFSLSMTGQGGFKSAAKVNFKNGTIVDKTEYYYENGTTAWEFTYLEFQGTAAMTFDNVTFNNTVMFDNEGGSEISNCTFKGLATLSSNQPNEYAVWVTKKAKFTNCTFENLYRGVKVANKYAQASEANAYTATFDACIFKNISKKPGVVIDNVTYENNIVAFSDITIKNSTFTDVQPGDQHLYIYETDNTVPTLENNVIAFATAVGLRGFAESVNVGGQSFSGYTIALAADIDLNNEAWTPVGQTGATQFSGIFDGQDKTIKNLKIDSDTQTGGNYSSALFGWLEGHGQDIQIKNVKVEGANIVGHHNVATIAGYITGTVTVDNCHVTNATISCTKANDDANGDKAGVIVGNGTAECRAIKNCTASNSTVSAGRDAGQIVGACKESLVTGCSATDVTVSSNGTGTGANISNDIIGRKL